MPRKFIFILQKGVNAKAMVSTFFITIQLASRAMRMCHARMPAGRLIYDYKP